MAPDEGERARTDRTTLGAFLLMVVATGGNVIAIKYLVRANDLDPLWAAASRFLISGAIFAIIARILRASAPRGRALAGALLYGVLAFGGFFGLVYWGLQKAPAALSGVLLATIPLLTFVLALAQRLERFRWDKLVGAGLVVAGAAVIFRGGVDEGVPAASLFAVLAAAVCVAQAGIVVKRFPPVHPAAMNAIGMGVGTVILLALMPVFGQSPAIPQAGITWASQAYLVTLGSVGVFAFYLFVLSKWSASAASYEFVLVPVVGIVLAALLLDEKITGVFAAGSILVLIGVYLGALRPARRTRA